MTAFSECSLESLCLRVTSGGTPSRAVERYWSNGTIPWFKTGELKDGWLEESEEKITDEALDNSSAKVFPAKTVLMAMYGDGKTITSLGILRNPATTNQACCAMIVDPDKCDYRFLFYKLKCVRHALLKLVVAGAQRNLSAGIIKSFQVEIPPLSKQVPIAAILSAYDDLIENNRRRIALLEQSARLLYREWFTQLRFPGHEHVNMVGGLPDGWSRARIIDLCEFLGRGISPTYDDEGNSLVVNQKCVRNRLLSMGPARRQKKEFAPEKALQYLDVLINSTGTGTLGRVAQCWFSPIATTFDSHVTVARPQAAVDPYWFGYALLELQPIFEGMGEGATNQKELSRGRVAEVLVNTPPHALQTTFGLFAADVIKQIQVLTEQLEKLAQARDLLLPRLMSGEIAV